MLSSVRDFLFNKPVTLGDFTHAARKWKNDHFFVLRGNEVFPWRKGADASKEDKCLHQKTLSVFKNSLYDAFGSHRYEKVLNRDYKIQSDLQKNQGAPLRREVIEKAGIAASFTDIWQLKEKSQEKFKTSYLYDLPISILQDLVLDTTRYGYLGNEIVNPQDITGGPKYFNEYLFDPPCWIKNARQSGLFEGVENLSYEEDPNIPRLHPYLSRLTMAMIPLLESKKEAFNAGYINPDEANVISSFDKKVTIAGDAGVIIPAPGAQKGHLDFYRVYDMVSEKGLTAVALTPISSESTLSPLICFRCTEQALLKLKTLTSIKNNLDHDPGESGYQASKKILDGWMKNSNFLRGKKPIVTGYSLGGAHAAHFMKDHWREVAECVCFNYVGNNQVVEALANEINSLPESSVPPPFYLYQNSGDIVNYVGYKHLGWGITHPNAIVQLMEFFIDDYPIPNQENIFNLSSLFNGGYEERKWLNLHGVRPLDSKRGYKYHIFRGRICDPYLDSSLAKSSIEEIRKKWGVNLLNHVLEIVRRIADFVLRLFGFTDLSENF